MVHFSEYFDTELRGSFQGDGEDLSTFFRLLEGRLSQKLSLLSIVEWLSSEKTDDSIIAELPILAAIDRFCLTTDSTQAVIVPDQETRLFLRGKLSMCSTSLYGDIVKQSLTIAKSVRFGFDAVYLGGEICNQPENEAFQVMIAIRPMLKSGAVIACRHRRESAFVNTMNKFIIRAGGELMSSSSQSSIQIWTL